MAASPSFMVIGAGLPRTGTLSLKTALDTLGFGPTYHMFELMRRPGRARLWLDAAEGRPVDWRAVLSGYRSTTDWPASYFHRELLRAFPDAKVVLTVRDPERWYDSTQRLLSGGALRSMMTGTAARMVPALATMNRLMSHIGSRTFGVDPDEMSRTGLDRERAITGYLRHQRQVLDTVPAQRLLVFDVRDGWGPLCAFLDVPVPDVPFPHRNEAGTFDRDMTRRTRIMYVRAVSGAVAGVAATAATMLVVRRLRRRRRLGR